MTVALVEEDRPEDSATAIEASVDTSKGSETTMEAAGV